MDKILYWLIQMSVVAFIKTKQSIIWALLEHWKVLDLLPIPPTLLCEGKEAKIVSSSTIVVTKCINAIFWGDSKGDENLKIEL